MSILPVKPPCTLTIIAKGAPLVLIVVVGHVVCCHIFGIWDNRLLSNPLWNLICVILWWVPTRSISLWTALFLDVALFTTLLTSYIWTGIWLSSRATNISTATALKINLIQILVYLLFSVHIVCLFNWRLFLRLFSAGIQFPPIWIHKIAVLSCILLYKGVIVYEILFWYDIHITHTKFLDKLRNLLVLMNSPQMESGVRSILKYASNVP